MARLHLYRNISITFIIFAAMILCAVFLLFYSQTTIIVTPDSQTVNLSFVAEVKTSSTPEDLAKTDAISGTVSLKTVAVEGVYSASSTKSIAGENIVGQVKIVNSYSKLQKLVKTTQLQAENGVIVRTNAEVTVPAGGSVEVAVYPKEGTVFKPVESGKLTIIKLWPQLQSKIYGQIVDPLSVGTGEVTYIADSDINAAKKDLIAKAVSAAEASTTPNTIIKGELVNFSMDKKLGDQAKIFTLKGTVKLKLIKVNEDQLSALIQKKGQKMDFGGMSANNIDLSLAEFTVLDATNPDSIIIKVSYPLKAYLTASSDVLAKSNFTNKSITDIRNYAAKTGVIKNIEVIISPYWRDKTPVDEKNIKIVIQPQ